ncbi:MAG: hypothetical protein R3E01_19820 [Pirellulaceae bacterium]
MYQHNLRKVTADPSDVLPELQTARALLQRAVHDGEWSLVPSLAGAVKLAVLTASEQAVKSGAAFTEADVHRLARRMVEITTDEIRDRPGYEDVIDAIVTEVCHAIG